jgi:Flp pilus assembly pilin Flp
MNSSTSKKQQISGQGLIEYALIILLIVLGVIAVLRLLGIQLIDAYELIRDTLTDL